MTNNYSDLGTSSLKFKNIYAYNIISDTYTGEIKGIDTGFDITGSGWRRLYTLNTTFPNPQTTTTSVIFRLHSRYSYNAPCSATFQIETRYRSAPIITMIPMRARSAVPTPARLRRPTNAVKTPKLSIMADKPPANATILNVSTF